MLWFKDKQEEVLYRNYVCSIPRKRFVICLWVGTALYAIRPFIFNKRVNEFTYLAWGVCVVGALCGLLLGWRPRNPAVAEILMILTLGIYAIDIVWEHHAEAQFPKMFGFNTEEEVLLNEAFFAADLYTPIALLLFCIYNGWGFRPIIVVPLITLITYFAEFMWFVIFGAGSPVYYSTRIVVVRQCLLLWSNIAAGWANYAEDSSRRKNFQQMRFLEAATTKANQSAEAAEAVIQCIFPPTVLHRLQTGQVVSDKFPSVTVVQTDIVGFTSWCSQQQPAAVVNMLSTVFARFDNLLLRHKGVKMKVIGDAYIAAFGLFGRGDGTDNDGDDEDDTSSPRDRKYIYSPSATPARDAVAMALAMVKESRNAVGLSIRAGCHTGEVIAGILGKNKCSYDLFGRTTEIASAMEQQSEPDKVLISPTTHNLVKGEFILTASPTPVVLGESVLRPFFASLPSNAPSNPNTGKPSELMETIKKKRVLKRNHKTGAVAPTTTTTPSTTTTRSVPITDRASTVSLSTTISITHPLYGLQLKEFATDVTNLAKFNSIQHDDDELSRGRVSIVISEGIGEGHHKLLLHYERQFQRKMYHPSLQWPLRQQFQDSEVEREARMWMTGKLCYVRSTLFLLATTVIPLYYIIGVIFATSHFSQSAVGVVIPGMIGLWNMAAAILTVKLRSENYHFVLWIIGYCGAVASYVCVAYHTELYPHDFPWMDSVAHKIINTAHTRTILHVMSVTYLASFGFCPFVGWREWLKEILILSLSWVMVIIAFAASDWSMFPGTIGVALTFQWVFCFIGSKIITGNFRNGYMEYVLAQKTLQAASDNAETQQTLLTELLPKGIPERLQLERIIHDQHSEASVMFLHVMGFEPNLSTCSTVPPSPSPPPPSASTSTTTRDCSTPKDRDRKHFSLDDESFGLHVSVKDTNLKDDMMSKLLSTKQMLQQLNYLYMMWDDIVKQDTTIEKIKNIGDIYFVVGNLQNPPLPLDQHLWTLFQFGQRAIKLATTLQSDPDAPFKVSSNVQCGLHVGPLSGVVLDRSHPLYDVFGDTVNVCSRMMGNTPQMNTVHLTSEAYSPIQHQLGSDVYVKEHKVTLKGKGEITSYCIHPSSSFVFPERASSLKIPSLLADPCPPQDLDL